MNLIIKYGDYLRKHFPTWKDLLFAMGLGLPLELTILGYLL